MGTDGIARPWGESDRRGISWGRCRGGSTSSGGLVTNGPLMDGPPGPLDGKDGRAGARCASAAKDGRAGSR